MIVRLFYSRSTMVTLVFLCVSLSALPQGGPKTPPPSKTQDFNADERTQHQDAPGQMSMGVLACISDQQGALFIDGKETATVGPDKILTVTLVAGQHFAELRDTTGQKRWEKVVSIHAGAQVVEKITTQTAATPSPSKSPEPTRSLDTTRGSGAGKASDAETNGGLSKCSELALLDRYQETIDCAAPRAIKELDQQLRAMTTFMFSQVSETKSKLQTVVDGCNEDEKKCNFEKLADGFYKLGKHDTALGYVNKGIAKREQSTRDMLQGPPGGFDPKNVPLGARLVTAFLSLGECYCTLAKIQFAQLNYADSVKDFDKAFESFQKVRIYGKVVDDAKALKFEVSGLATSSEVPCRQARAVVLFRLNGPEDAIRDFDAVADFQASVGPAWGKLPPVVEFRNAIHARLEGAGK